MNKSHHIVKHCLRLLSVLTASKNLPAEERCMMDIDLFDWMVSLLLLVLFWTRLLCLTVWAHTSRFAQYCMSSKRCRDGRYSWPQRKAVGNLFSDILPLWNTNKLLYHFLLNFRQEQLRILQKWIVSICRWKCAFLYQVLTVRMTPLSRLKKKVFLVLNWMDSFFISVWQRVLCKFFSQPLTMLFSVRVTYYNVDNKWPNFLCWSENDVGRCFADEFTSAFF